MLLGHLAWIAARLAIVVSIYLAVMAAFGVVYSPWAILALPAAVLTGMAFAAPVSAFAATQDKDSSFSTLYRFAIIPMFLFSGTFFPISQLPTWLQVVAYVHAAVPRGGAVPRPDARPGRAGRTWGTSPTWCALCRRRATRRAGGPSPGGWWCESRDDDRQRVDRRSTGGRPGWRRGSRRSPSWAGATPRGCSSATSWSTGARGSSSSRASSSRSSTCSPSASGCPTWSGPINVDGQLVPYTAFVAPGLLASSAMNGAMLDSTFLVFFKLKIAKTYDAMLSTPLGVGDVALGELSWCVLRGALYSGAFLAIMAILGYIVSPWAVLCWPAAVLISLAFAVGRHGRHHLHADLAGLRHGLAGLHPAVPLLRHLLPAHRVPGLAAGRRPLHAPLPGGGARAAPPTWASGAGPCWATSPTWWPWPWSGSSSPDAASARCSCRDRPPRAAGTVGPISRAQRTGPQ